MRSYTTLSEATDDLRHRGFTTDLEACGDHLTDAQRAFQLRPEDFSIVEVYRFEGDSDPTDMTVVYAIESKDGLKGQLVDAYGADAHNMSSEMAEKLSREQRPKT